MAKRKPLLWITFLAILLAITFLGTETFLRIYQTIHPLPFIDTGSYLRWKPLPHTKHYETTLNSTGYKDKDFVTQKRAGWKRIVLLGDSYAFGIVPYEKVFPTLLEEKLAKYRVEVYNFGIPGTGPRHYYEVLQQEAMTYQPDMVVLCFFGGNDYNIDPIVTDFNWCYSCDMAHWMARIMTSMMWSASSETYEDDVPLFTKPAFDALQRQSLQLFVKDSPHTPALVEESMGWVLKIQRLCKQEGIEFRLIHFPDRLMIDDQHRTDIVQQTNAEAVVPFTFDMDGPSQLLQSYSMKNQVHFLDLKGTFKGQQGLYKENDTHLNIKGNQVAAEAIATFLEKDLK